MRSSGERLSGYGVVYEPSMVSHKGFSLLGSQHEDANVSVDKLRSGCPLGDLKGGARGYTVHSTGIGLLAELSNGWESKDMTHRHWMLC